MNLVFGLTHAVPPAALASWGARWIYPDDMVYDRQSFGPDDAAPDDAFRLALREWLNGGALAAARKAARAAAAEHIITPSGVQRVILHRDARGVIVACPNASHGYLYVGAWLHSEAPELQPAPEFVALPPVRPGKFTVRKDYGGRTFSVYRNGQHYESGFWSRIAAVDAAKRAGAKERAS